MGYQVLYRRFRPASFSEIVGQDHIIPILQNQIRTGNIAHAYLFSGPRGTGKTSAAKVFAKAVNCLSPVDGEPCGKCSCCLAEATGALSNVIEIDAASNRGIDEMRKLREEVNFLPAQGKYRVYIIDEVHMLTNEAFNALLITLEEPPEDIIFIFATTEVYKVLPTILSRCQRYDFKRIAADDIKARLRDALAQISVECEEGALNLIVTAADGALRDAWSIADKVMAASGGNLLSEKNAREVLGGSASDEILQMAEAICEANAPAAFTALNRQIDSGADTDDIHSSLTEYFRSLMIYINVPSWENMLYKSEDYIKSLKRSSVNITGDDIIGFMSVLAQVRSDSRYNLNMRYLLETALLKMSDKDRLAENLSLKARVEKLEKRIEALLTKGFTPGGEAKPSKVAPVVKTPVSIESLLDSSPPRKKAPVAAEPVKKAFIEEDTGMGEEKTTDNLFEDESEDFEIPEEFAITQDDKDVMADMYRALQDSAEYINNHYRDQLLWGIVADMKPDSFDGQILKVYPTGGSILLMEGFYSHKGVARLEEAMAQKLGRQINIEIIDSPMKKDTPKKDNIDIAKEIFGSLKELPENEGE